MTKERITEMIDKKILESFSNGFAIKVIQNQLEEKANKFAANIKQDPTVDLLRLLSLEFDQVAPVRTKFGVAYIKQSLKRIKDLEWVKKNKYKFPQHSSSQVFNLLKLKEKLSKENALPF
jgi:hypothetical protein